MKTKSDIPTPTRREANRALLLVSLAVLLASSVWFSGTAAALTLRGEWGLSATQTAWLTASVQLGFISGTLLYAFLNLADRFNARRVFLISALFAAGFNAGFALFADGPGVAAGFRFLTGMALAGVYPVGMKIVASWFQSGLGWRLGVLVGALTLGTASPYLIQAAGSGISWRLLTLAASAGAILGGVIVQGAVSDGLYLKTRARFDGRMLLKVFRHKPFRYCALGYFGHMWELYAFWSLITFYLGARFQGEPQGRPQVIALLAFCAIAVGSAGCVLGGWISRRLGERRVALVSLLVSGCMCALSGLAFHLPFVPLLIFILIWGLFVVSDSPQFSALGAKHCPPEYTGTALTIQNGIGFAITAISIQLLPLIAARIGWQWAFTSLMIGPAIGAYFMHRLGNITRNNEKADTVSQSGRVRPRSHLSLS